MTQAAKKRRAKRRREKEVLAAACRGVWYRMKVARACRTVDGLVRVIRKGMERKVPAKYLYASGGEQ